MKLGKAVEVVARRIERLQKVLAERGDSAPPLHYMRAELSALEVAVQAMREKSGRLNAERDLRIKSYARESEATS